MAGRPRKGTLTGLKTAVEPMAFKALCPRCEKELHRGVGLCGCGNYTLRIWPTSIGGGLLALYDCGELWEFDYELPDWHIKYRRGDGDPEFS